MSDFIMDSRDIRRLGAYFKDAPEAISPAVRASLNHLARRTVENDKTILRQSLTIRDERLLNNTLRTRDARGNRIQSMEAAAFSIKRDRFTGYEEQERGGKMERTNLPAARGGNRRRKMLSHARLQPSRKIYKPEQFQGRNLKSKFMLMMRIMGTRGGGQFLISDRINTRRGGMNPGLYRFKSHNISKLQSLKDSNVRPIRWRTRSLQLLRTNNNLESIWARELEKWVHGYR
jgi:hypothetical protein